jgi:hypothetical protein
MVQVEVTIVFGMGVLRGEVDFKYKANFVYFQKSLMHLSHMLSKKE